MGKTLWSLGVKPYRLPPLLLFDVHGRKKGGWSTQPRETQVFPAAKFYVLFFLLVLGAAPSDVSRPLIVRVCCAVSRGNCPKWGIRRATQGPREKTSQPPQWNRGSQRLSFVVQNNIEWIVYIVCHNRSAAIFYPSPFVVCYCYCPCILSVQQMVYYTASSLETSPLLRLPSFLLHPSSFTLNASHSRLITLFFSVQFSPWLVKFWPVNGACSPWLCLGRFLARQPASLPPKKGT